MSGGSIGVIGAGLAGLACADLLAKRGYHPVVFDKGRGVGGRLATRRTAAGFQFDHGAQFVTAKTAGFGEVLSQAREAGVAGNWTAADRNVTVGVPSMNAIAKSLAAGLDIRLNTRVTKICETANGWQIADRETETPFDHLVIAVPQPQVVDLIGKDHPLAAEIAHVTMSPCWTLMAAFPEHLRAPFSSRRAPDSCLAWVALNSSKPERPDKNSWVVQASADWSARNLERDPDDVARELLLRLCGDLRFEPTSALHVAAHRWRYAKVETPYGKPFCRNASGTLYLGGDWCLDARAEAAWTSGVAIAEDLLEHLDAK